MRTYITALMLAATLGLVSCGGGNDVASSGATAVSAAAPTSTITTTEAKVNGQIDERTGVAPVVAQATLCTVPACPSPPNPWTVYSNGGCAQSNSYWSTSGAFGPLLTSAQQTACNTAVENARGTLYSYPLLQCPKLGGHITLVTSGSMSGYYFCYGGTITSW